MLTYRRAVVLRIARALLLLSFALPVLGHADTELITDPPPLPPGAPVVDPVTIASNNASSTLAKTGDVLTLSFTVDVTPLITPSATIAGHDAAVLSAGGNAWTASTTMLSGDTEGVIAFSITAGNADASATTTASAITSGSNVTFDRTAPTITLTGDSSITLTVGDTFTDPGATASDAVSASVSVTIGGSVDTATAGSYVLTYNASDDAGNTAAEAKRTVTVNAAPEPAPARVESGGGSGGSLYPIAPVFNDAPPAAPAPAQQTSEPAQASPPPASEGAVAGARTASVEGNPAKEPTASAANPAPRAEPVSAPVNAGPVAQARPRQAPVAQSVREQTPPAVLPDTGMQEGTRAQAAASGLLDLSLWWLLVIIILALAGGYFAWRKYQEYRKRREPAL